MFIFRIGYLNLLMQPVKLWKSILVIMIELDLVLVINYVNKFFVYIQIVFASIPFLLFLYFV